MVVTRTRKKQIIETSLHIYVEYIYRSFEKSACSLAVDEANPLEYIHTLHTYIRVYSEPNYKIGEIGLKEREREWERDRQAIVSYGKKIYESVVVHLQRRMGVVESNGMEWKDLCM